MSEDRSAVEKLKGPENWPVWKFAMKHVLLAKGLWEFVDGTAKGPGRGATEGANVSFKLRSEKAITTIVLGMESKYMYLITTCETAEEVWEKLSNHFESKSVANRLFLKKEYFRMKMVEGQSMESHLKRMKEAADQLSSVGAKLDEEDHVAVLLGSLSNNYSGLVTAIGVKGEEVCLDVVQQLLVHEEMKQKGEKSTETQEKSALISKEKKKFSLKCYNCGKNHLRRNCPDWKQKSGHDAKKASEEPERSPSTAFMMNAPIKSGRDSWIIDSGASSHMTWDRELYNDLRTLSNPEDVLIGDGNVVKARGIGEIAVNCIVENGETKEGILYNVLYIPELRSNLFSVLKGIRPYSMGTFVE